MWIGCLFSFAKNDAFWILRQRLKGSLEERKTNQLWGGGLVVIALDSQFRISGSKRFVGWLLGWRSLSFLRHWLNKYHEILGTFWLTLSWWRFLSYRTQSIDLWCKSMDWFIYDRDLRHDRVNSKLSSWWLCRLETVESYSTKGVFKVVSKMFKMFLASLIFHNSCYLLAASSSSPTSVIEIEDDNPNPAGDSNTSDVTLNNKSSDGKTVKDKEKPRSLEEDEKTKLIEQLTKENQRLHELLAAKNQTPNSSGNLLFYFRMSPFRI